MVCKKTNCLMQIAYLLFPIVLFFAYLRVRKILGYKLRYRKNNNKILQNLQVRPLCFLRQKRFFFIQNTWNTFRNIWQVSEDNLEVIIFLNKNVPSHMNKMYIFLRKLVVSFSFKILAKICKMFQSLLLFLFFFLRKLLK